MTTKRPKRDEIFEAKKLIGKSDNQIKYIESIRRNSVTICTGPAGTGKTTIAVGVACELLLAGEIKKIVITRPTVDVGGKIGFLPGGFTEKIDPYLVPIFDEMEQHVGHEKLTELKENGALTICPLQYMRGRNLHNSFMILDEAQNATFKQIIMFMTRIGRGSKMVLNGDMRQSDLDHSMSGGLDMCISRLQDLDNVALCQLDRSDIVRHKIIADILARLEPEQ